MTFLDNGVAHRQYCADRLNYCTDLIDKWYENSEVPGSDLFSGETKEGLLETDALPASYPGLVLLAYKNSYGVPMMPPVNCCQVHRNAFYEQNTDSETIKMILYSEGRHFNDHAITVVPCALSMNSVPVNHLDTSITDDCCDQVPFMTSISATQNPKSRRLSGASK